MADFFQDVFNKTKKFANNAVDETKDAAQKAKLNNKISNEIQMIDRNMVEIGKYFYEQAKGNPPQELMQYFNNIRAIRMHSRKISMKLSLIFFLAMSP